jgi:acyl carrier protein
MTVNEFHETISAKVKGTWNLHNTSIEMGQSLEFLTLLSSTSGLLGQKGQANYAAANVFLDAFAAYRHSLGLAACSIDLGIIHDVGYIHERSSLVERLKRQQKQWHAISEAKLHEILKTSILQQTSNVGSRNVTQLITGIPIPQEETSELLQDSRFRGLCFRTIRSQSSSQVDQSNAIHSFLTMIKANVNEAAMFTGTLELVNKHFTKILGLSEAMEPGKPLAVYGLDSLSAVELRNWVQSSLNVEVTMLDILNAISLSQLCDMILLRLKGT